MEFVTAEPQQKLPIMNFFIRGSSLNAKHTVIDHLKIDAKLKVAEYLLLSEAFLAIVLGTLQKAYYNDYNYDTIIHKHLPLKMSYYTSSKYLHYTPRGYM